MRVRLWAVGLAAALCAAALTACRVAEAEPSRGPARFGDVVLARDSEVIHTTVPPRTTLAALLAGHRVLAQESAALVQRIAGAFDLRRVRAGQPYSLDRFFDGRIREFQYEIDGDKRLVAHRDAGGADFDAEVVDIPKTRTLVALEGVISRATSSLIAAIAASATGIGGERSLDLALSLADIFSGQIDFNNDLQPGDRFRLLVESATRDDGLFGGYGPILAAELVNEGTPFRAVRFALTGAKPAYYDEQGRSIKRFFLKSPLKFDPRITSRFSRGRLHPVLNYVRAHNGVDYGAPPGAPVAAVASGTVLFAGWTNGGGRTVKVRHLNGYDSEYLHLSAIASGIRAGARVAQGDLIGRVGATGLVTGPHLHYGLKRNGVYVNPVREQLNMPPGEPVPALSLADFTAERDRLFDLMTAAELRSEK